MLVSVAMIDTTPDGMFSKAEVFDVYPKPLMRVAENVVMTPDGMTIKIVARSSSQTAGSSKVSTSAAGLNLRLPLPA